LNNLTISVLSISYNCEKFIDRSYKMLQNQTLQNFEWIFVDDGSTDNTQNIIKDFNDNRIHYYRLEKNRGRGFARNFAISKCNSEYISIWDLDDFYINERLELALYYFEQDYDCSCSSVFIVNDKKEVISARHPVSVFPFFNRYKVPIHPTLNIKKKFLSQFPYLCFNTVGGIGEDYNPLFATALFSNCKILNNPTCFYFESREVFFLKALHSNYAGIKTGLRLLFSKENTFYTRLAIIFWLVKTIIKYVIMLLFFIFPKLYLKTLKLRNSEKLERLKLINAQNILNKLF